jgi:hypothetical protein
VLPHPFGGTGEETLRKWAGDGVDRLIASSPGKPDGDRDRP